MAMTFFQVSICTVYSDEDVKERSERAYCCRLRSRGRGWLLGVVRGARRLSGGGVTSVSRNLEEYSEGGFYRY